MLFLLKALLFIHIAAGFTALTTGAVAFAVAKGGAVHRRAGTGYFYAMITTLGTAVIISLFKNIVFLLMIAVFTGYRAIQLRRQANPALGLSN